jgi:hypothetical protein
MPRRTGRQLNIELNVGLNMLSIAKTGNGTTVLSAFPPLYLMRRDMFCSIASTSITTVLGCLFGKSCTCQPAFAACPTMFASP